jgi:hypothetical protein
MYSSICCYCTQNKKDFPLQVFCTEVVVAAVNKKKMSTPVCKGFFATLNKKDFLNLCTEAGDFPRQVE